MGIATYINNPLLWCLRTYQLKVLTRYIDVSISIPMVIGRKFRERQRKLEKENVGHTSQMYVLQWYYMFLFYFEYFFCILTSTQKNRAGLLFSTTFFFFLQDIIDKKQTAQWNRYKADYKRCNKCIRCKNKQKYLKQVYKITLPAALHFL